MGEASVRAWEVIDQKRKYWHKALSDDASWTTLAQTVNVFDFASYFSDLTICDSLFSSIVSDLLLDIKLADVVPVNVLFDTEMPTPEEFTRGVRVKVVKIRLVDVAPEAEEAANVIEEPHKSTIEETKLRKGIYGETRYDESYYDPTAVRELLRSTMYAFLKKDLDLRTAKAKLEATAEALGVNPELARNAFNRLSAIASVKYSSLTWDYGWWDLTTWGEEGSEGLIGFTSWELTELKLPYEDLIDLQIGGFWDESCWDLFHWSDVVHPYRIEHPSIAMVADKLWTNFRKRLMLTALAVSNYQTYEERTKWHASGRLETYALPVSLQKHVEHLVETIVTSALPGVDAVTLRLYKSAVLELLGELTASHRWGAEAVKAMGDEERKTYWLRSWEAKGLDRGVLELLYSKLKDAVRSYVSLRQKERIRFLRKKLFRVR